MYWSFDFKINIIAYKSHDAFTVICAVPIKNLTSPFWSPEISNNFWAVRFLKKGNLALLLAKPSKIFPPFDAFV